MSWFQEGYEAVDQKAREIEERMNRTFMPRFQMEDGEEAHIIFLTTQPINIYEHFVSVRGGKRTITCPQVDCPICAIGNRPQFKGVYLILDTRTDKWKDRNGEEHEEKNRVKMAKFGITVLKQLQKQHQKRGLHKYAWEVTRTGKEQNTSYSFIPVELDEVIERYGVQLPNEEQIKEYKKQLLEVLKPKPIEELQELLLGGGRGGTEESSKSFFSAGDPFGDDEDEDEDVIDPRSFFK